MTNVSSLIETDAINKRLNKVLETRLDGDKDVLEALSNLSSFFTDNTIQTRRNLRSVIEKKSLTVNEDFLFAFAEVKDSLDSICNGIATMTDSVSNMQHRLRATQSQTHELIEQTNGLQAEANKLQINQQIAGAFLTRFQLSPIEHQLLYEDSARDRPMTMDCFKTLSRVQAIHADCRVLLQSGYQTAALDIMEDMTLHEESALERLYRWTQTHCRSLDVNDEIGGLVVLAMSKLQERPVLFKYVIDEFVTARRAALVRNFIDALTIGGGGGGGSGVQLKPIEMHAHDPKRYIGDMFAWIHQALPSEKDNLFMLLKQCDKNDLSDTVQLALAQICDGLCHPLKIRVETVLNSETDLIVLYAVSNLIRFYQNILNNIVRGGQLEECLLNLHRFSEESYLNWLTKYVRQLLQPGVSVGVDLLTSQSVNRLIETLKELLSVASMVDSRQSDITKIVSCVIDPLLHSITESASHLPTVDMAVYLLNCLYQMQGTLTMYEYMDERIERLQGQAAAQIDTLTSEQASSLVANLNLGPIYTILQQSSTTVQIDSSQLNVFMNKFESFLEMPDILLLPQINLLQSSTHRSTILRRSFSVIIAIYTQLYERVGNIEGSDIRLGRTPAEVSELLSG